MSDFSTAYGEVARLFREHGGGERIVPRPAALPQIEDAERALGAPLPESFRKFQLEFGECENAPIDIYSLLPAEQPGLNLVSINLEARTEMGPRLPAYLIAFSDNGAGDLLCFDTRTISGNEAPVVYWDHELDEGQTPEPVALSFVEWLRVELEERIAEEQDAHLVRQQWENNVIGSFAQDVLRRFRRGDGNE
jgi:SMI1/KNR4 family protein SUKH-1